jgi:hypothetical protein
MDMESSTVTDCGPVACISSSVRPGQDDRVLADQQVRAVELRGDVNGKVQIAHGLEALLRVRQCHRQIASQAYKYLGAPIEHRFHCGDGIVPVVTRGLESKGPLDVLQHRRRRFLPDADCAIALNIGVAAQWADAGARFADVAA